MKVRKLIRVGAAQALVAPALTTLIDRLFSTDVDECDGSGTCVGTGDPCTESPYVSCCEVTDLCLDPNDGTTQCPQ
jgi:hypothetical protein